ncbi:MAG: hypothetical protein AABX00_05950 [Nanoarchaeota archaeon]
MCESYMMIGCHDQILGYMDAGGNVFHSSGIAFNSNNEMSRNTGISLSDILGAIESANPMPGIHRVVSGGRDYNVVVLAEQLFRGSKPHYLAEVHQVS